MTIATISQKGQITLPVAARKAVGIKARDQVFVEVRDDALVIRPAPDLMSFKGFLRKTVSHREERASAMECVANRQAPRR